MKRYIFLLFVLVVAFSCSSDDDSNTANTGETKAFIRVEDVNGSSIDEIDDISISELEIHVFTEQTWEAHRNEIDFADQSYVSAANGEVGVVIEIPGLFETNEIEQLTFMSFYVVNSVPKYRFVQLDFRKGDEKSGIISMEIDFTIFQE